MSDIAVKNDISMTDRPAGAARRTQAANFHRILGIDFFDGSARAAIALMREGGLLVIPAAPALKDLDSNPGYRDALLNADHGHLPARLTILQLEPKPAAQPQTKTVNLTLEHGTRKTKR